MDQQVEQDEVGGARDWSAADYTPNPKRAIHIEGQINEALFKSLLPDIFELTIQNREPITVAGSGGRRNTCAQFTRRSLKAQSFSWTLI
jgi:hypothetical protein